MKYPYEIVTVKSKKTFSVNASFVERKEEDDKPLEIFDDKFSRFAISIIQDGKAATANIKISQLAGIIDNYRASLVASKTVSKKELSSAFTVRFNMGKFAGKTPAQVLIEQGEEALNEQYTFLKKNLEKYPNNKIIIDAIKDAARIGKGKVQEKINDNSSAYKAIIYDGGIKGNPYKEREDGMYFCSMLKIYFDTSRDYPITITISNFYAPVIKDQEKGTIKVQVKEKDESSEILNTFSMTTENFSYAISEMEDAKKCFKIINFKNAFASATNAHLKTRKNTY